MAVIALVLLIPLLGLAILYFDSLRQTVLPFESRGVWTVALKIAGSLAMAIGLALVAFPLLALAMAISTLIKLALVGGTLFESLDVSSLTSFAAILPLMVVLGLICALTGAQTFRVPQSWPSADEDGDNSDVIERYTPLSLMLEPKVCQMRSGAWLMTLYPLLYILPILGILGAFLLVIAAMVFSTVIQSRRAFQSQLLWLITISVRNKLPLAEELRSLSKEKGVALSKKLQLAAQDLDHGDTLSMALERHQLLPASTLSTIRVSEGGNRFEDTLRRLSIQATERLKTFNLSRLSEVFIQVITLLSACTLILSFVMYFIVPKFKEIFIGFGVELPAPTVVLINIYDQVFTASSVAIFWIGIGIAVMVWQALRHLVGWSSLPFPVLMHWFPKRDAPEVLRAIWGIAREEASLPQKIMLLTDRRGRPDLGARYRRISESLSAGESLSNALFAEGLLTPLQRETVAAGERGGHLEFVLCSLAEAIEQREFRRGAYWAELLKPAAIVTCGIATGFIVFALFLPLIKLLNDLS